VYWETYLLPKDKGYIYTRGASDTVELYSVGMLHQLHCLGMLRSEFTKLLSHERDTMDFFGIEQLDYRNHLGHCMDLIRQVS